MAKGIRTIWIDSDTPESLGNKVIKDDVEIATVPNGVQEYKDPDVVVNRQYKYVIQSYTATGQSTDEVLGDNLNYYTIVEGVSDLTPIMTNFRVNQATPTQVHFDAPLGSVQGVSISDFTISGKTIVEVDTTFNYFTVVEPFTYWQQAITVRKEGNDTTVWNFELTEADNLMDQPATTSTLWVDKAATGNGSGSSEANAFTTIMGAVNASVAGTLINVKVGTYPEQVQLYQATPSINLPLVIQGYKVNPGDLNDTPFYAYGDGAFDPNDAPLISSNIGSDGFVNASGKTYFIIRNFQIFERLRGIYDNGGAGFIAENIAVSDCANSGVSSSQDYTTFRDIVSFNNGTQNITFADADFNLVKNCDSQCDSSATDATDYYYEIRGKNNVVIGNNASRNGDLAHTGHGFSIAAEDSPEITEYNLIKNNTAYHCGKSFQLRHEGARYNVIDGNRAWDDAGAAGGNTGIVVRDAAHNNTFKNNISEGLSVGINMHNSGEVYGFGAGNNNTFYNNIIKDNVNAIRFYNYEGTTATCNDNKFFNNVFYNNDTLYRMTTGTLTWSGNLMTNNIFDSIPTLESGTVTGFTYDYNNIWNSWATSIGTNSTNLNPDWIDTTDFVPQTSLDAPKIAPVYYDERGNERSDTTTKGVQEINVDDPTPPIGEYDYYVSEDGTGDGSSESTPMSFAESQTTINSMISGESIAYKGGDVFDGNLTVNGRSGITLTSYGTGQAIIKGSKVLSGFTNEGSNIWSVPSTDLVYKTLKDSNTLINARTPDYIDRYEPIDAYYQVTSKTSNTIFISSSLVGMPDLVGGTVQMLTTHYILEEQTIIAFNSGTGQVTLEGEFETRPDFEVGDRFFVIDNYNLLTVQDEWFYDNAADKLYIYSTTDPVSVDVIVTDSDGMNLTSCSNITVDNLNIKHFNGIGIYSTGTTGFEITNNTFEHNVEGNIRSHNGQSGSFLIDGNYFYGSDEYGVYNHEDNMTITNNVFEDIGTLDFVSWARQYNSKAISSSGDDGIVQYNRIIDCGYLGIVLGGEDILVDSNVVKNYCLSQFDGGGIYSYNGEAGNTGGARATISNNIVYGNPTDFKAWSAKGIYMDDGANGFVIENNTVAYSSECITYQNSDFLIRGNKLYKPYLRGITDFDYSYALGNSELYDNIVLTDDLEVFPHYMYTEASSYTGWTNTHDNIYYNTLSKAAISVSAPDIEQSWIGIGQENMTITVANSSLGLETNSSQNSDFINDYSIDSEIGSNLIPNPDFETDLSGWTQWNTVVTRVSETGQGGSWCANVSNTVYGGFWTTFTSEVGADYEVKFRIKTTRDVQTNNLIIDDDSSIVAFDGNITFNNEWSEYSILIKNFQATTMRFAFYMGGNSQDVFLDDISVIKVTYTDIESTYLAINETSLAADIALPVGTWDSIDGTQTNKTGTVNVPAYGSYIMIKQ